MPQPPPDLALSQPVRAGVALALGLAAWGVGQLTTTRPAPPTFLRCPELADGRVLHKVSLTVDVGPAPKRAVPGSAADLIEERLFVQAGCEDGWLTWEAAVAPTQLSVPRAGYVAVATELAHVRPQERVNLFLGDLPLASALRVLTVDGLVTDDDGHGGQRVYPTAVPVTLEVPEPEAAHLQGCLALGAAHARTAAPSDAASPPPDCATIGRVSARHAGWAVAIAGLTPGARYDLLFDGLPVVRGARAVRADGLVVPDAGRADPAQGALIEVPESAVTVLQRCGARLPTVAPSAAPAAALVAPDACRPAPVASRASSPKVY